MKSAIKKAAAGILTLALVGSLLAGCAAGTPEPEPSPEDTVAALEQALNAADPEAVLECLSSDLVSRIQPMLALCVGDNGTSVSSLLGMLRQMMPMLPAISGGAFDADDLPRIALTAEQTEQDGDEAKVCVTGVLSCGDLSQSFSAELQMQLEEEIWVITGIA